MSSHQLVALADSDFVPVVVEATMADLAHGDLELALGGPSWRVAREPTTGVELWLHRAPTSQQPGHYLYGSPNHRILVSALADGPLVHTFHAPERAIDVFDSDATLSPEQRIELAAGRCLPAPAYCMVLDVQPGDQFYLELISPTVHTVRWTYERDSLRAAEMLTGDSEQNRILTAIAMLGELDHQDGIPTLEQMATHRSHVVRWAAVQALFTLSESAGRHALERACRDRHPDICRLARSSLHALEADSDG